MTSQLKKLQPSACIACNACETVCPQRLKIPRLLRECMNQLNKENEGSFTIIAKGIRSKLAFQQ
ncbi:4Fe-4S binding protein [Oscillibacter sp. 1-3]|uniref:4Fe-4S binding protein n=1 Tax=Oscillibacter sp. 1-3 TaxID=1235797 RepID=UPI0012DBFB8E